MSIKDMLVEIRHTIVARGNLRQERQGPAKASSKNQMVDTSFRGTVFEMHSPFALIITGDV